MKQNFVWVVAVLMLAASAGLLFLSLSEPELEPIRRTAQAPTTEGEGEAAEPSVDETPVPTNRVRRPVVAAKSEPKKARGRRRISMLEALKRMTEGMSEDERKLFDDLQSASDDENLEAARKLAEAALGEKDTRLREKAIEVLGGFGIRTITDLLPFIKDADEDVASAANDALTNAFGEFAVGEEAFKVKMLNLVLSSELPLNADSVSVLAGHLQGVDDEALVVETAANLIDGSTNGKVIEEMKEIYRFVTDGDFVDAATAKTWVQNKRAEVELEKAEAAAAAAELDEDADDLQD